MRSKNCLGNSFKVLQQTNNHKNDENNQTLSKINDYQILDVIRDGNL